MIRARFAAVILGMCGWLMAAVVVAQSGRLEGLVTGSEGEPLSGVRVVVVGADRATVSDAGGHYGFNLPPGTYTIEFSSGDDHTTSDPVVITADQASRVDRRLQWAPAPTLTAVTSVAGFRERAIESAATIGVVGQEEIDRSVALLPPNLFQAFSGVNVAQSGLEGFSLNAQGFDRNLSRNVTVLLDGRDLSLAFFGGQDWAAFPLPMSSTLAPAEMEIGNDSARYGADAVGGVLNLVTHRAGERRLQASFAGGDQSTKAGELAVGQHFGPWAAQVTGDLRKSGDDTVSRNGQAEYSTPCTVSGQANCLPQEAVSLSRPDDDQIASGTARVDRGFGDGGLFSMTAGFLREQGPTLLTDLGRIQVVNADHRWGTVSYDAENWDLLGTYTGRGAGQQVDLTTGENQVLTNRAFRGLGQTSWGFLNNRLHVIAGAQYQDERVDSEDQSGPIRPTLLLPTSQETMLFQSVRASSEAAFGQAEWEAGSGLQLVAGARYDSSSLWDSQLSGRVGLAWAFAPGQVFRLRFDRGFIAPTEEDLFLQTDVAAPVNLASLENLCAAQGVGCGFDLFFTPGSGGPGSGIPTTRIMASGNRNLKPEHVNSVDAGWSGSFGRMFSAWVNAYWQQRTDVITPFVPELGTSLGRVNPLLPAYQPSPFLPAATQAQVLAGLQQLLGPLFPYLTTSVDGTPIIVLESKTNAGTVDGLGADVNLRLRLPSGWTGNVSYSYLDSTPQNAAPDLARLLSANTPKSRANAAIEYAAGRFSAMADYRWVQSFEWISPPFEGQVPSYGLVDLAGRFRIAEHFVLGVDANNLLDKKHYEVFGGDLTGRRVLGSLTLEW
jgi:outer membrane cobalamin receptor